MATDSEILTSIQTAISENAAGGAPTEVQIDDRKVKFDLSKMIELEAYYQRKVNSASTGTGGIQRQTMTFGGTRG